MEALDPVTFELESNGSLGRDFFGRKHDRALFNARRYIKATPVRDVTSCISTLFNCCSRGDLDVDESWEEKEEEGASPRSLSATGN